MTSVSVSAVSNTVVVTENGSSTVVTVTTEGPQGAIGPEGPQGPIGVGIPAGGTTGQLVVRTEAGTEWTSTELAEDGDVLMWIDNYQRWESKPPANASAPRSITITYPEIGDSFTLFRASRDLTIANVSALVSGGSVTYQLKYDADRTASGTAATASSTVTSTTTGDTATIQNQPVAADDWVWVEITVVTGAPVEFNLSVAF